MTTAAETSPPGERSCFLTVHASVLCVDEGSGFVHRPLAEAIAPADLLVAGVASGTLRALAPSARVEFELSAGATMAATSTGGAAGTVNLRLDGTFLSAGDGGGAVVRSDAAQRWEEFLPVSPATIDRLRALVEHDWVRLAASVLVPGSANRILPGFALLFGGTEHALGGVELLEAGAPGRLALCTHDHAELLQRVTPRLVWRHDGTAEADAEIGLGLASLRAAGGFPGRLVVESAGDLAIPLDGIARDGVEIVPAAGTGLLSVPPEHIAGQGPVLMLANGVMFDGPAAPIVAHAAALTAIAAAPWLRDAWEALPAAGGGEAVDPSVIAGPGGNAWEALGVARRFAPDGGDAQEAAALRMVLAAGGQAALRGFVSAGGPDAEARPRAGRGLLNLRAVPREIRAEVMQGCLGAGQGKA